MRKVISEKLQQIEIQENVRILHAVESGSRAWGFESPDSDFDVRFIYVRTRDYYLKLERTRDVLEFPINDLLDINGWDLQKALRLLTGIALIQLFWNGSGRRSFIRKRISAMNLFRLCKTIFLQREVCTIILIWQMGITGSTCEVKWYELKSIFMFCVLCLPAGGF